MEPAIHDSDPTPSRPGVIGCGECLKYRDKHYHYNVGKFVPKDKVVALKWEGNYCGRVHGDKEFIIVAWDGEKFLVLDYAYSSPYNSDGVRAKLKRFKGMKPLDAIALVVAEEEARRLEYESRPKCTKCGQVVGIRLDDNQSLDMCWECFKKIV